MKKNEVDFWDERYSRDEFIYGEQPNEYLKQKLAQLAPGKALFAAEGEGRNAVFAAKSGWIVSAFDQSEAGKTKAKLLAKKNGVEIDYVISDIEDIIYTENSFDALVLIFAHFHSDLRNIYHQKLSKYLNKGGILILEAFSKKHSDNQKANVRAGGPQDVRMLYDLEDLKADFDNFVFVEVAEAVAELNEGNHHVGKADVIRILAIKK